MKDSAVEKFKSKLIDINSRDSPMAFM